MHPAPAQDFISKLIGLPVSRVWLGHGSALFLEFGALRQRMKRDGSPAHPDGEMALMIEWSWRIEDQRSILCGSWSDEPLWDETFSRLLGTHVTEMSLFGRLPEIDLCLSSSLHVLSFMTAEGQPTWTLFDNHSSKKAG